MGVLFFNNYSTDHEYALIFKFSEKILRKWARSKVQALLIKTVCNFHFQFSYFSSISTILQFFLESLLGGAFLGSYIYIYIYISLDGILPYSGAVTILYILVFP